VLFRQAVTQQPRTLQPASDIRVLVAPPQVLADIGFAVKVGDRIRARVFYDPASHTAYAQKLLNESQDLLVRLRTLRHEPLWDAAGTWQGAAADAPRRRAVEVTRERSSRPAPSERPDNNDLHRSRPSCDRCSCSKRWSS